MRPDVGKVDDDVCDGGGRHCRRLQEEVDVQEHGDRREAQQGAHEGRVQLEYSSILHIRKQTSRLLLNLQVSLPLDLHDMTVPMHVSMTISWILPQLPNEK